MQIQTLNLNGKDRGVTEIELGEQTAIDAAIEASTECHAIVGEGLDDGGNRIIHAVASQGVLIASIDPYTHNGE